jgi:uncharacterized protein (DUF885 family)
MRVRLYLTPFWREPRLFPGMGLLSALDRLWYVPHPTKLLDYEERIRKFDSFPEYVKNVAALLREAKAEHMLPARRLANESAASLNHWLEATGTVTLAERTLYAPFQSMPRIATTDRERVQEAARSSIRQRVLPAVKEYYEALAHEYLPSCPEWPSLTQWPNGAEVYRVILRLETTSVLAPKQVQEFGLQEVKRIRDQMAILVPKTGFSGSLDEFLKHVRTDPQYYFSNGDQLLAAYRSAIQEIEPLLPKVVRRIPKLSVRVEPVRGGVAAMYLAPNPQHADDLVYVETGDPGIHPKFEVIPLMLHEALPGHALQHAVAREFALRADSITSFKEEARQSVGFGEGWGLYAETLGRALGLYRTSMDEFGALRMELKRAVRVVVDTGVHLSGWSVQQAREYVATTTGEPEAEVELEIGRLISPGTLASYKVGENEIEALRDAVKSRLKNRFDLRGFDDMMLQWGPLPLEVMRRKVDECLTDERCSQAFQAN